jgi:hypothetical protein
MFGATELPATSVPGRVGATAGPLDDKVGAIAAAPNGVLAGVWRNKPIGGCSLIYEARDTTLELITP